MTLIEVVMALAVLSVLLVVAIGSLSSLSRSKKAIDDYQDVYLVAQSLLRRVTRELQLVTCDKRNATSCDKARGLLPPPDRTDERTGALFLAEQGSGDSLNSITFLAMEAGQYLPGGETRSGMVQISYRLGKEEGNIGENRLFSFIRDEIPYIFPASEAYKKRITFPITSNVVRFDFQFYDRDNQSWTNEWGKDAGTQIRLPVLIKFSLVLRSANGVDIPFETIVPVTTALQR
jgi:type II secretory pathway pseudopilin PulG